MWSTLAGIAADMNRSGDDTAVGALPGGISRYQPLICFSLTILVMGMTTSPKSSSKPGIWLIMSRKRTRTTMAPCRLDHGCRDSVVLSRTLSTTGDRCVLVPMASLGLSSPFMPSSMSLSMFVSAFGGRVGPIGCKRCNVSRSRFLSVFFVLLFLLLELSVVT